MDKQNKLNIEQGQVEDTIRQRIFIIRHRKVMLDADLAKLYGVTTKVFNQAVRRNLNRFPEDFIIQLNDQEVIDLNRSQFVTGSQKHRNPSYMPYVFTEHGVAMLSSVLNSERAVQMNIFIIRTFIKMRESLEFNKDLANKVNDLERKQKEQGDLLKTVNNTVSQMIEKPERSKEKIGFNNQS